MVTIRRYEASDETSWLRCRLLSFFETAYYDDVKTSKTTFDGLSVELVAVDHGIVVGLIDVEIDESLATIDSIAVHPDHSRRGIATALVQKAIAELPSTVTTLDAWTRDDEPAIRWYQSQGMRDEAHYLHVYKHWNEPDDGFTTPDGLSTPVTAFMHAPLAREAELRERFSRVVVCRRFVRALAPR
ncbi:GNAT family N-acetyltransferase [Microcella sp.]|uniref:GNAT family N-acetyltransferase n=1 Tax=Microcella sp. TaxID=1913979 RepID=UPI0025666D23|nr:GNAT family N-acetyltransferase [Microcella sp.]MBX9471616.1 GNAT family N-acetyltransferase [Microcella sp.]